MTTKAADGYRFAVDCAIECADDHAAAEFYRGMASGLHLWAEAVSKEQWDADSRRIAEAREVAKCATTATAE